MDGNLILVTNWEKVEADDFYLSDDWAKNEDIENIEEARKLQKEDNLYRAYIVDAKNYAIYWQMDADEVYVNNDMDIILRAESSVIGNEHAKRIEYDY
jgi:hypothetical protein